MKAAALVVLAAALAACGKAPEAPAAPTAAALGAELATFPQLLVPISTTTWAGMQKAIALNDMSRANADQYPQPYAHYTVRVGSRSVPVIVAYTGVWLAPAPTPLQPMSVQQYLRAFGADPGTDLASVIAPKGRIFFTREQLPDVIAAARAAGAASDDLPYSIVHGVAR